jgi:glutamate carboxypeptidase
MDLNALPFDADDCLRGLRPWIECESPTWDAAAVNRMMGLAARDLAVMGARIEPIAGRMGFGDCLRATFPHRLADQPGILVLGHLDTVHPVGTLAKLPFRRDGAICYGPGIVDMKGGNYIALEAIRQLGRAGIETPLPVTVLFTSDEEVGSPSTRDLIEAEAARHAFVLVPEPARENGGLVTGRYAIARYNLETVGKPTHAGIRPGEGRSALREMARRIIAVEEMTTESCTFSVGVIESGKWVNCVPSFCRAEALSMAKRQDDLDRGVERMLALSGVEHDVTFTVTRGVTRPVWEPGEATLAMFEVARGLGRSIGMELSHASAGGGSDGNFTGANGIATLDGLGVEGKGYHTLEEHVEVESLSRRGRLMAGLLATLGADKRK